MPRPAGIDRAEVGTPSRPHAASRRRHPLFLFFSNRLGCMGSLLISLAVTVVLVLVFFR
ncbi:MAG TPA: hypothetical protein VFR45_01685 [Nocardioides sp.]|nr:hypothetical protein [Nocardioides sp.]